MPSSKDRKDIKRGNTGGNSLLAKQESPLKAFSNVLNHYLVFQERKDSEKSVSFIFQLPIEQSSYVLRLWNCPTDSSLFKSS